jgi:hypothetical protein
MFDELKDYAQRYPDQFQPWFTLSHPPEPKDNGGKDWEYSTGHLDEKVVKERFFAPDGDKVGTFL